MIRSYNKDDLPALMDIGNRAWREIYRMYKEKYGPELFKIRVPDERTEKGNQIRRHCEEHPEWVFVCEEEGRIVGFVTFQLDKARGMGLIGNNAVDPECGLKGIGQQMYSAVLNYFRSKNMKYATVRTGLDPAHERARKAYERAGFNIRSEDVTYHMKL